MVAELLTMWSVKAAWSFSRPILEDLAKDVAKDAAKSYVGKCFASVFSSKNEKVLVEAVGQTVKELLDLLEYELGLDEDTEREELIILQRAVDAFLKQEAVQQAIASLLQEPQYLLDAALLAQAWRNVQDAPPLPDNFSWQRISKRFSRKAAEIRDSIPELKAIFAQNAAVKADEAIASDLGPQPGFDLDIYAEAVLEKFGRPGSLALASVDLDGPAYDAVRLWQVFVPQSVRECRDYRPQQLELPKGEEERREKLRPYFEQQPRPVLEVCADQQLQRLVLLGDPGSGKSSLLRFLALEWARNNDPNRRALAPVPLLIELRDYHSKRRQGECSDNFLSYLHKAYSLHRFNQNALDALLKSTPGRFLLLLDGLDEIFDRQEREQVISDIHRFSNEYKEVRIIVTSRVVGYEAHRLRDAEFRDFMLQDFSPRQIAQFLGRWHEVIFAGNWAEGKRKWERLAKAISESNPIKLLAGNPLLLTMMAIINRNRELPRNRVKLYEQAVELLLQQWDTERHLQDYPGLKAKIESWAKAEILRKVAFEMQTSGSEAANLIQEDKLINLIGEYLERTFGKELLQDHPRNAAEVLVKQLRERNFILCFLGGRSYGFVHRTFLEYFCAMEFVDQFNERHTLKIDGLLALYDRHYWKDEWDEVLRLICGKIDESFAGQIIDHLIMKVHKHLSRRRRLTELAACCLSEVKNPNGIQETIGGELLLTIIKYFLTATEVNYKPDMIYNERFYYSLLSVAKSVGQRWPGKEIFVFSGKYPKNSKICQELWPLLLASIFRQRNWIEQLLQVRKTYIQRGAIEALITYWNDDRTYQIIMKHNNSIHLKKAGIPPDKIDETVRSLSAHMGWDITKGSLAGKL